ncbi:MAG: hypothetical protein HY738_03595 [Bacteroidia bacterium]|nr:hypothetical protein [Bacteroidia bacterium]
MGIFLRKFKSTLLIEILNDEIGKMVESQVDGLDYLYYSIVEANKPKRVNSITSNGLYNYLICSGETARMLTLT